MTALRQRKGSRSKEVPNENQKLETAQDIKDQTPAGGAVWAVVWTVTGSILGMILGLLTSVYVATLHENDLWFSNIKEVEREISFRTECGLYYSYYKQMLQAPSIKQGVFELINDNNTESKRTINLLQRMNIYQELFLSILYRILPVQEYLEPVYFYIYTVFGLQTVYVMALYITSWLLSGTWLAGILTATWYILNRIDTTRVEFTIPLRENWALPFFALQVAAITYYLRPHLKPLQQKLVLSLIFISTLCFSLTWQFNQFILLIQAFVFFSLDCLDLAVPRQVTALYLVHAVNLFLVWLLQFCNSMLLGSLVLSFIFAALIVRHFQRNLKVGSFPVRIGKLFVHLILVFSLTFIFNYFAKKALMLKSDEHIYKFIKAKFGLGSTRDFDAKLYLCEEAFGLMPLDTFERLAGTLVLYPYICALTVFVIILACVAVGNLSDSNGRPPQTQEEEKMINIRPDVAYNVLHTVFFGLLAFSTMRMKYLWTGHMCAFAAYGVCSREVWGLYLKVIRFHTKTKEQLIRYTVPFLILAFLYYKFWPKLMEEISELREFYDPDTVELMNWISSKTSKKAVFAGSMQLLAGIKLCTGRVLTNHPHYEDKVLRERTRQVYQIYARQAPEDVHKILRAFGTDYIILEDSICYERRHSRGCRLRDLLDVANGHIMDGPGDNDPDLKPALHPRFCDEIKTNDPSYTKYFTRIFKNKTFHVYKLKRVKKKAQSNKENNTGV
ncbi:protein C-mannosyl-transferase DPY19L3 isoform X1 [Lepisosteus oculatus]|uniref:Dpy-19 like C-mannosyltransferase 3 n=1 Tax=Lepisosteus oculatus TaxID=7918 RepID=W5MF53_LEPOC|nr:PREDICTED: probable C-mannosyltransferase DPY19L3 isoform X1 [Lepisosteus oculatus]XP_015224036.1 PREDICTED: probable C-mannosyltransferase DPY19L3 isoform X1 [Lepisosteus oculatus]XP_015224037.1 PREDICTED: probable C-mannosyltransferase DPY19L3 isoform X1 [Lepisosteus oculatus]XP_015224038.1 PREDICTED: probable C-mannosyltransferase DPY19L3 isoform X1 [Lepisosteus oculatus]XP_015224039.1 PREDICTED: probable C-mannosyltransferase DPY19L3 isoform X1 [Lepisosteus oculatus]